MDKKRNKKLSVGVAVCRYDPQTKIPQVLLVKCRLTYSFNEFVFGKYKFWDNDKLTWLFNNMTVQEKLLLQSCDFTKIWYHIWLRVPVADAMAVDRSFYQFYVNCKIRFEKFVAKDHAKRLKQLIGRSTSIDLGWEIPKGRTETKEHEIDCAVREVREETGVDGKDYKIMYDVAPIVTSFTTEHCVYVIKYYVAADVNSRPVINLLNHEQISEITDVRFMSLKDLQHVRAQNKTLRFNMYAALQVFKARNKA